MHRALSARERQELRESLGPTLGEAAAEVAALEDPAELELAAALLLPPIVVAEGPPGALEEMVALIGAVRGGRRVLRAMAAAGPPPLSLLAREAAGPVGDAAEVFGRMDFHRASLIDAKTSSQSSSPAAGRVSRGCSCSPSPSSAS